MARERSKGSLRQALFVALSLVFVLASVEVCSLIAYRLVTGSAYTPRSFKHLVTSRIDQLEVPVTKAGSAMETASKRSYRLHPFVGYVVEEGGRSLQASNVDGLHVTEFGYLDVEPPLHRRSSDSLIVGVVGGSVANLFTNGGHRVLGEKLEAHPRYRGRRVIFVRLAMGSYKQPQQLLTLAYIMSLGGEFDIVVNIDGFNEISLFREEFRTHRP